MKCPQCGNESKEGAKFCGNCGCPLAPQIPQQQDFQQNQAQPMTPPIQQPIPQKPQKKFYQQWYFWVIFAVVITIVVYIYAAAISYNSNSKKAQKQDTTVSETVTTVEEETTAEPTTEEPTTQKPTEDPAEVEQEFKDSCSTIDFSDLSRNPDKYKGNNYKFTGQVIQVQEGLFDTVDLRIDVTKIEYEYIDDVTWTDTIFATVTIPEGADKILEDDVITFWGTCDGDYSYTSVLGNKISLPKIDIEYYELNN